MSDISLSKAVRSNLLSLQNTSTMMAKTQERLATGNKVNSALDNPTNFFTASGLNSRAGDLNQLMDSMANGIQTLQAADNGLKAITKTLESMQSTLRQARQDKSFQTQSYAVPTTGTPAGTEEMSFTGGAFATPPADLALTKSVTTGGTTTPASAATITGGSNFTSVDVSGGDKAFTLDIGAGPVTVDLTQADSGGDDAYDVAELQAAIDDALGAGVVTVGGGAGAPLTLTTVATGVATEITIDGADVADLGFTAADTDAGSDLITTGGTTTTTWKTVDELVAEVNDKDGPYAGNIRASNDNGRLRLENLSTSELTIAKPTAFSGTATIDGNSVRGGLADQFNELRDTLDKLSDDASFNGINLLRGDLLRITFNETGNSSIDIQTKDEQALNSSKLNLFNIQREQLDSDGDIDDFLATVKLALSDVRSQASTFGSNLSIVQNRQDFTKNMINTLETGAANLTLADMNEEAANLLALQTRQSLSSSSLSLASQADQSVLQLLQ